MLNGITKIIAGFGADIWMFIMLGLIVLAFLVVLIVTILTGDVNKFKKAAKIVAGSPDARNANAAAKKMPVKVTKLYKRSRATGEKPGDVIGIDAAINTPFYASVASKFALIVGIVSAFATLMMLGIAYVLVSKATEVEALSDGYTATVVVALAGLLFTVIAYIVSALFYKGAVKAYDRYIAALDTLSGNGGFERVSLDDGAEAAPADSVPVYRPEQTDATEPNEAPVYASAVSYSAPGVSYPASGISYPAPDASEDTVYEPVAQSFSFAETKTEKVEESYRTVETAKEEAPEPEVIVAPPPVREYRPEPEPRPAPEPAISYSPLTAADLRARAEQARAERAARAAEQAAVEPQGVSSSADEVIQKIEKASAEGAPLSTMKEIALQLQQERQKPENKTPEIAKKLSDAQVMLIKAMSSAMRR